MILAQENTITYWEILHFNQEYGQIFTIQGVNKAPSPTPPI